MPRTNSLNQGKRHDYLRDIISEKEEKNRIMSSQNMNQENEDNVIKNMEKKWGKTINNNKGTLMENISDIKEKISSLEKEAKMQEKLLKLNGGIGNNPKIGKKVSNLLINSIEAKLSILNQVS